MRKTIVALCVLFALVATAGAQDSAFAFDFEGIRMFNGMIPGGLDLSVTYRGLDLGMPGGTELYLKAGGGYEDKFLLRNPLTGDPVPDAALFEFKSVNFQWELAFIQGLAARPDGKNLLEAFVFYRGRYDKHLNDASTAAFPDIRGMLGTAFMLGASYDSVETSPHRAKRGILAEASAELGPAFLNAIADYWRVSGRASGYLPLFDLPTEGNNLLNVYAAGLVAADYAGGGVTPMHVNVSFGGRWQRDSLGDCVRGFPTASFDSSFKLVGNAELRVVGPALFIESIVPVLFGFVDAGWYAGFAGSTGYAEASGALASAGGGLAIDLFGFAQLGALVGTRLTDAPIYDLDTGFFWKIQFFFHF